MSPTALRTEVPTYTEYLDGLAPAHSAYQLTFGSAEVVLDAAKPNVIQVNDESNDVHGIFHSLTPDAKGVSAAGCVAEAAASYLTDNFDSEAAAESMSKALKAGKQALTDKNKGFRNAQYEREAAGAVIKAFPDPKTGAPKAAFALVGEGVVVVARSVEKSAQNPEGYQLVKYGEAKDKQGDDVLSARVRKPYTTRTGVIDLQSGDRLIIASPDIARQIENSNDKIMTILGVSDPDQASEHLMRACYTDPHNHIENDGGVIVIDTPAAGIASGQRMSYPMRTGSNDSYDRAAVEAAPSLIAARLGNDSPIARWTPIENWRRRRETKAIIGATALRSHGRLIVGTALGLTAVAVLGIGLRGCNDSETASNVAGYVPATASPSPHPIETPRPIQSPNTNIRLTTIPSEVVPPMIPPVTPPGTQLPPALEQLTDFVVENGHGLDEEVLDLADAEGYSCAQVTSIEAEEIVSDARKVLGDDKIIELPGNSPNVYHYGADLRISFSTKHAHWFDIVAQKFFEDGIKKAAQSS